MLFIAYELTTAHSPCQIPIQLRRPFISCHTNNKNRSTSGNVLEALIQSKLRDVVISRHPSTTNQRREPFGVTQLSWKCTHKLCMIGHGSDFSRHRARLISLCPEWRMIFWVEASVDITFDWLLVDWLVKQKLKGKILLLGVVEARQTYHLEHISSAMRQLQNFKKGNISCCNSRCTTHCQQAILKPDLGGPRWIITTITANNFHLFSIPLFESNINRSLFTRV